MGGEAFTRFRTVLLSATQTSPSSIVAMLTLSQASQACSLVIKYDYVTAFEPRQL
jgi:hypothetical protein